MNSEDKITFKKDVRFSILDRAEIWYSPSEVIYSYHIRGVGLIAVNSFCEYSFDFLPEKLGINDEFLPSFLEESYENDAKIIHDTGLIGGSEEGDEERFPLTYPSQYFGSIRVGNQTLYMIEVPENAERVRVFDKYNDDYSIEAEFTHADDIKILWILISEDGIVSDLNIAYHSWKRSKNPERNMHNYLLHQVDKRKIDNGSSIRVWKDEILEDTTSSTILSTKKVLDKILLPDNTYLDNTPLYNIRKAKRDSWYQEITYSKGSQADRYISVEDNNTSTPFFSPKWVKEDLVNQIINRNEG